LLISLNLKRRLKYHRATHCIFIFYLTATLLRQKPAKGAEIAPEMIEKMHQSIQQRAKPLLTVPYGVSVLR